MQKTTVSIPFMLLGILFNVCLIAANLLETKVVQIAGITATAGLIVFPVSYIINDCIAEVLGIQESTPDYLEWIRIEFPCDCFCPVGDSPSSRTLLGG